MTEKAEAILEKMKELNLPVTFMPYTKTGQREKERAIMFDTYIYIYNVYRSNYQGRFIPFFILYLNLNLSQRNLVIRSFHILIPTRSIRSFHSLFSSPFK